jgi:alkyl hydroperoxide reductase subunit AhpC
MITSPFQGEHGILNEEAQSVSRTTFVVDKQGKIQHLQEGNGAIGPTNAIDICTNLHQKESGGSQWALSE